MKKVALSTEEKALQINLQPTIYGVFAEIGAGQEVVNHFYNVGATSGTVAKSISAYDMSVSDSLYGITKRYVSQERLQSMLSIEYQTLIVNLSIKAPTTHFFAFANTIELTPFNKDNKGRGWMGIKFQKSPNMKPSNCDIHFVFHTADIQEQREITGKLGVNLIFGVYEHHADPEVFIESLMDNLDSEKVEINFIEASFGTFFNVSNMELNFMLVKYGLTKMIMIDQYGNSVQPISAVHNKDVILVRGRFRPPTLVTKEMFKATHELLKNNKALSNSGLMNVAEMTFRCYRDEEEMSVKDYMLRANLLNSLGYFVIVSNFKFHHELINYANTHFKLNSFNIVLGTKNLTKAMSLSSDGLLKLVTELENGSTRLVHFPQSNRTEQLKELKLISTDATVSHMLRYLFHQDKLLTVKKFNEGILPINSDRILEDIKARKSNWKKQVPKELHAYLTHSNAFMKNDNPLFVKNIKAS